MCNSKGASSPRQLAPKPRCALMSRGWAGSQRSCHFIQVLSCNEQLRQLLPRLLWAPDATFLPRWLLGAHSTHPTPPGCPSPWGDQGAHLYRPAQCLLLMCLAEGGWDQLTHAKGRCRGEGFYTLHAHCIDEKIEALQVSVALSKSLLRLCLSSSAPFSFVLNPGCVQS